MSECPEWDNFVAVPYRKADKDHPQQQKQTRKDRKNRKDANPTAASQGPSSQPAQTIDPFSRILPLSAVPDYSSVQHPHEEPVVEEPVQTETSTSLKRGKDKFVPLFAAHGEDLQIKLQGRHPCQCMCTHHNLVHNCTNCGRIVCEQEGSGPCFTCGELVCKYRLQILAFRSVLNPKITRIMRFFSGLKIYQVN